MDRVTESADAEYADDVVVEAQAWLARFALPEAIQLGRWNITHREYGALEVRLGDGTVAAAYALTRDGSMQAALDDALPQLMGRTTREMCSGAVTCMPGQAGNGHVRVEALVEACGLDLRAQRRGEPLWRMFAGDGAPAGPVPVHAVAVCGYPTSQPPTSLAKQVGLAVESGCRIVKIPGLGSAADTARRLDEIRSVSDEVDIIVDLEAAHTSVDAVSARVSSWADRRLLWVEDPFPASHAALLGDLMDKSCVDVAIGDEWSMAEAQTALGIDEGRVVVRLDYTTIGGLAAAATFARQVAQRVSWHVYPEHHRHLGHAGIGVPVVDVFPPAPKLDFANDLLESGSVGIQQDGTIGPPAGSGSGVRLDRARVDAHSTWSTALRLA